MPSLKKLQAVASYSNKIIGVLILTFICFIAASQTMRTLKPSVYQNFIKSSARVKIQTIEGGKVKDTSSAVLNNFAFPVNQKRVVRYEDKISAIDKASYQKLQTTSALPYPAEDIKIIPELHIEPHQGQAEDIAYRIMFTLEQPLHYNDSLKKFIAQLGFLLISESGNNDPPGEPVSIEVLSNEVSSIKPESFKIDHLSIPSSRVELIADQVNDSASVKVITASNPNGYITYIKVEPAFAIFSDQNTLQGFGIQEIPVTARFVGSNSSDSLQVNFSSQKGTVTSNSVYVHYNRPATVYLRSEGIGNSKLSATSNTIKIYELNFRYVFPWLFLLASILGGLLGSLAKYFLAVPDKKSSVKPIIGGILIGFIGAIAYYGLGVNLLGISLSAGLNELAVLALSALCAYFGISLIKLDGKQ
jgi:hypothetical protein